MSEVETFKVGWFGKRSPYEDSGNPHMPNPQSQPAELVGILYTEPI